MNSSKSALLSAIIAAALLLVALGLIFAFLPNKKHAVKAQGNLPIVADRPDDHAAVESAKQYIDGRDIDLWQGLRKVATFEHKLE